MRQFVYFRPQWRILPLLCGIALAGLFACAPTKTVKHEGPAFDPAVSLPAAWSDEPVIVISDSIRYALRTGFEGNELTIGRATWYYVNKRNPTLLENIYVNDCETTELQPTIEAKVFYPSGTSWSPSGMAISRFRCSNGSEYSSNVLAQAFTVPRYCAGTIIRLEVRRTCTRPEFYSREPLRSEYPVLHRLIEVSTPKGFSVKRQLFNRESLGLDTATRLERDGAVVFTVKGDTLKKISTDHSVTRPEEWFAALACAFPPSGRRSFSWQQLGDYYLSMIEPSLSKQQSVPQFSAVLPGGDPDSIAKYAYLLVRKRIRYHSDLEKLHAIIPQAIDTTIANGYGDCKEMASLLVALLRQKKVECGLALVSSSEVLQAQEPVPTLDHFNHVIVYYKQSCGTCRMLDPTIEYGSPFDSYCPSIGCKALMLRQKGSFFTTITPEREYKNSVLTSSVISRDSGGSWSISGTILLLGRSAHRMFPRFQPLPQQETVPFTKEFLKKVFNLDVVDAHLGFMSSDSIAIRYSANFEKNYLTLEHGGLLINGPSIAGGELTYTTLDPEGPHAYEAFAQEDTWEVPQGFGELESVDLSCAGLAKGAWKHSGHTRIVRTYSQDDHGKLVFDDIVNRDYFSARKAFTSATLWR